MKRKYLIDITLYLLVVFGALILVLNPSKSSAETVSVNSDEGVFLYPLTKDQRLTFQGPLGQTEVEIKNGTVSILSSPCPTKQCMHSSISSVNQSLVCLPNRVAITIKGKESVDAVSY